MAVEDTQPLISHLIELRKRLLNCIIAVLVIFLVLVYFANDIYQLVASPLISQMPVGSSMIATDVASPFFTPIKLTIIVSVFLAVPVILYQVWAFVAPALYRHERRLVMPLLFSSTFLFYFGVAFAYFVVFPLAFGFFTKTAPIGVTVATDIAKYLDVVMTLFMAFGVAFEVPVAIVLLCWTGITSPEDLKKKRPYILVGAFVVGMLLTPPASPACLLPAPTRWRASRLSDWLKASPAFAGLPRAFTLIMPANGRWRSPVPCADWRKNRKWSPLVSADSILIATSRPMSSRSMHLTHSWRWPQNSICRCSCTAVKPMRVSLRCLPPGCQNCRVR